MRSSIVSKGLVTEKKNNAIVSYYPSNNGAIAGSEKRIYLMPGDKLIDMAGLLVNIFHH